VAAPLLRTDAAEHLTAQSTGATPARDALVKFDETGAPAASGIVLARRLTTELVHCLRSVHEAHLHRRTK
jgi:hypothetical protein